jgi:hypothetical protein
LYPLNPYGNGSQWFWLAGFYGLCGKKAGLGQSIVFCLRSFRGVWPPNWAERVSARLSNGELVVVFQGA